MPLERNYLKFCVFLCGLALLAPGTRAMAVTLVPLEGQEKGAIISDILPFAFPFAYDREIADGEATQVGHYALLGDLVANVVFGTAAGSFTMTAVNGDVLFLDGKGGVIPTDLSKVVWNFTITGGTGRFEDTIGSFTTNLQLDGPVGSISPNPYVATLKGAISPVPDGGTGYGLIAASSLAAIGFLSRGRKATNVGVC